MKIPAITRVLALIGLCALAVPIMGGGTECPKDCVIEGAKCAKICGGPETYECKLDGAVLKCLPPDEPDETSK